MAVLKLVVLKNEQLKDGNYKVKVSIFHKGKTCYISTDYKISSPSHLKNGIIVKEDDSSVKNSRLRVILNRFQSEIDKIEQPGLYDCSQIKDIIIGNDDSKKPKTLSEAGNEYVSILNSEGRLSYAKLISKASEYFVEFANGDVFLCDITPIIIESFAKHLNKRKKPNGALWSKTMVNMVLSRVKVIINFSIREQYVSYQYHPFLKTRISRSQPREVDLSIESFRKVMDFSSEKRRLQTARDVFILSFLLGGMNLIDLINVDFTKDEASYSRTKTKGRNDEIFHIYIHNYAREIARKYTNKNGKLDFRYNFTYRNLLSYICRAIRDLGEFLGIKERMAFYSARKSFSQYAKEIGISDDVINYCLAHSNSSRGIMQYYTRTRRTQAKDAIIKVVDYVTQSD